MSLDENGSNFCGVAAISLLLRVTRGSSDAYIVLQQKIINAYGCDAGFIPYNRTFFSDNDDLLE